jgi:leader peptidase (prepilin peptidase)/N-methyltransferase
MLLLAILFIFILGAVLGSFLNVVIYRYNSSVSPLVGRSQCFSCGKTLSPHELIPIVSFLVARGRCAGCGVKISWQYLIVEALTGAMFVAVFMLAKPVLITAVLLGIFCTLIVIAVYDLRHQIIPDGLVILFAVLAVLKYYIEVGPSNIFHFPYVWTLLAGPILFIPFWVLWFVSRGRWIGLGDGKLALGIGWFLGVTLGATAVTFAFWIGAAFALSVMAVQKVLEYMHARSNTIFHKKLSMQSAIPFGPLLILAIFIVYFTRVNLFDLSGILQLPL